MIDITVPIYEGAVVWPGSPRTVLEPSGRMNMGESPLAVQNSRRMLSWSRRPVESG